ncbi:MAG TPA: hemagglutinin, partial [Patescibacteria group bacterium]|nr:hemagglutinin [Patescibacteria group bacterium]
MILTNKIKKLLALIFILILMTAKLATPAALVLADDTNPTPTETQLTPTDTPIPTDTVTPTNSPTPTGSEPTGGPVDTPTNSPSPTIEPSSTSTPTPTNDPSSQNQTN